MNTLLLLLRYRLLEFRRLVVDNLFPLLGLGPMILGVLYLLAAPYIRALATGVYSAPDERLALIIVSTLILLLLLAPASTITSELFPLQSADAYLDSLPISTSARFGALAVMRVINNLPILLTLTIVHYLICRNAGRSADLLSVLASLIPALLQLSALQILLVLLAAHFGFLRITRMLPLLALLFAPAMIYPALNRWLLAPITGLREILSTLLANWFDANVVLINGNLLIAMGLALVYFVAGYFAYQRWSVNDREAVERALGMRRRAIGIITTTNLIARFTNPRVAAHLFRDLILTFRFFSSAVYLSFALASLFQAGLIVFAVRYNNAGFEFDTVVQAVGALATFTLAALTPALVKHQLQFIWIERSLAVEGEDMYNDKLWYARLISLPAPIISFIIALFLSNMSWLDMAGLFGKLLLVWMLVASFVGALSFEMASRPSLAIPFTAIASLSLASIVIQLWALWLIIYPYAMDKLKMRAQQRTRILLTGLEGDYD